MLKSTALLSALALLSLSLCSCETPGQSAMAGAGLGAAIGGLLHGSGSDALSGAAIGAGAGYLLGKVAQSDREEAYYEERYDERYTDRREYPQYREPYHPATRGLPVARRTNRYGFVTSPYRPFNLIDVRGIPRGARTMDPSTNRIFINP